MYQVIAFRPMAFFCSLPGFDFGPVAKGPAVAGRARCFATHDRRNSVTRYRVCHSRPRLLSAKRVAPKRSLPLPSWLPSFHRVTVVEAIGAVAVDRDWPVPEPASFAYGPQTGPASSRTGFRYRVLEAKPTEKNASKNNGQRDSTSNGPR